MKAILIKENKSLIWMDVPDPIIKDDEVLIKIYYAALNRDPTASSQCNTD